jgi:hypothetical protein
VLGRSSLSWGLGGGAGTSPLFVVARPLRGGAISSTHPPCEQVLAAVEGGCGRGLCRDAALASRYSILVGVGGVSVDVADYGS